eukprot:s1217_g6.t3
MPSAPGNFKERPAWPSSSMATEPTHGAGSHSARPKEVQAEATETEQIWTYQPHSLYTRLLSRKPQKVEFSALLVDPPWRPTQADESGGEGSQGKGWEGSDASDASDGRGRSQLWRNLQTRPQNSFVEFLQTLWRRRSQQGQQDAERVETAKWAPKSPPARKSPKCQESKLGRVATLEEARAAKRSNHSSDMSNGSEADLGEAYAEPAVAWKKLKAARLQGEVSEFSADSYAVFSKGSIPVLLFLWGDSKVIAPFPTARQSTRSGSSLHLAGTLPKDQAVSAYLQSVRGCGPSGPLYNCLVLRFRMTWQFTLPLILLLLARFAGSRMLPHSTSTGETWARKKWPLLQRFCVGYWAHCRELSTPLLE